MTTTAKRRKKIERIENFGDDGWWLYYGRGWKSATDPVGCLHQEHEDTKREVMRLAKIALPCNCEDCKAD